MTESPDLPFQLRFEDRGDYLFAEVSGPQDSVEITTAYWQRIARECERRGVRRLLVADRLRGRAATPEELQRYLQVIHDSALEKVRIAFYEPEPANLRLVEHADLEAIAIGLALRVFGGEREAEVWLRYGED